MKRGSTPHNTFDVDIDLTGATVYITYVQNSKVILEKSGADVAITPEQLSCDLTQEETLRFCTGPVEMQVAYVFPDGTADRSDIIKTTADRILHEGVLVP